MRHCALQDGSLDIEVLRRLVRQQLAMFRAVEIATDALRAIAVVECREVFSTATVTEWKVFCRANGEAPIADEFWIQGEAGSRALFAYRASASISIQAP